MLACREGVYTGLCTAGVLPTTGLREAGMAYMLPYSTRMVYARGTLLPSLPGYSLPSLPGYSLPSLPGLLSLAGSRCYCL